MYKKLVLVPHKEQSKIFNRLYYAINGSSLQTCANLFKNDQYNISNTVDGKTIVYSYISENININDQILKITSEYEDLHVNTDVAIIFTDIESLDEDSDIGTFDEIINISTLKDYYQAELSFNDFIVSLLEVSQ